MSRLFDDIPRTDSTPQGYSEDTFEFLNRVAGTFWDRVRAELELWYVAFPDADGDVRARFRKSAASQHYAAWWELYLHRLFTCLGFEIEVHPRVERSTGRPDFTLTRDGESLYVEAVMVASGIQEPGRHAGRESVVLDAINKIAERDFMVTVHFESVGAQSPPLRKLTEPIRRWLDRLRENIDDLYAARFAQESSTVVVATGDWRLELTAIALSPTQRGRPDNRLIGIGPVIVGSTNDKERLRSALRRKRRHYGVPDRPLLVAALGLSATMDDDDVVAALYGSSVVRISLATGETHIDRSPDGVWVGKRGLIGKRVSGVLMGHSLGMYTMSTVLPRLWHHPDPTHPVAAQLPFPSVHVVDAHLDYRDGTLGASDVLNIPPDWPGPDPPFPY